MSSTTKANRKRPMAAVGPQHAPKRRVTQESIDKMAELRRQGLPFHEIGARVGCSERTVRRFAGQVRPQLTLPEATMEPEAEDSRALRGRLARGFAIKLQEGWNNWESVRFIAEANRLVQERLSEMDSETLRLVSEDGRMREHFFWETTWPLHSDLRHHLGRAGTLFDDGMDTYSWIPPSEREDREVVGNGEILGPGDEAF